MPNWLVLSGGASNKHNQSIVLLQDAHARENSRRTRASRPRDMDKINGLLLLEGRAVVSNWELRERDKWFLCFSFTNWCTYRLYTMHAYINWNDLDGTEKFDNFKLFLSLTFIQTQQSRHRKVWLSSTWSQKLEFRFLGILPWLGFSFYVSLWIQIPSLLLCLFNLFLSLA